MTQRAPHLGMILLVEDNPNNLNVLIDGLSPYGFDLSVAPDGESALEQSVTDPPDLILLDIMMPGMDGFETCARLKDHEKTKDIPVIFMTALSDTDSRVKGFSVGAVDFVTKPLQLEEVVARVNIHLKIRALQLQLEETISNLRQEVGERKRAEEAAREAMVLSDKANKQMRKELAAAARVQHALLPASPPVIPGVSFAWTYQPCAEVGGDSLNVFQINDHHVGLYVLDVTGHGVSASLLSVTLTHVLIPQGEPSSPLTPVNLFEGIGALSSPAEVASRLNHMFPMSEETHQFFTLVYGILDIRERLFRYVCAGHPAPILLTPGHTSKICEAPNLPIGLFHEVKYEESTIQLTCGSRLYLYSDGVIEAMNREREIFGDARLRSTIEDTQGKELQESVNVIGKAVHNWTTTDQVQDDLSILAMELK
ncbi:MAG: SpoIIE family protein phosphatase [Nitrospirales bacterium]|nr:SpoIIE family protein phosphatase [Nitrospirales bacterium]